MIISVRIRPSDQWCPGTRKVANPALDGMVIQIDTDTVTLGQDGARHFHTTPESYRRMCKAVGRDPGSFKYARLCEHNLEIGD